MSAKVMDVMTRKVVAAHTNASFKEIAATLRDRRVSAFPVLDDAGSVTVTVKDRIVTLAGSPETAQLGHDIVAAVRHLEGVVAVRNRLNRAASAEYVPLSGPLF